MTKEEIKAFVAAKIAGQGNQVDVGGALAKVLNEIVDAIPEGGGGVEPLIYSGWMAPEDKIFSTNTEESAEDDIEAAFKAGRPVIINLQDGGALQVSSIVDGNVSAIYGDEDDVVTAVHYTWSA